MLIKIAIILHDNSKKAMTTAKQLEDAVRNGEMMKVDLLSDELEALTDKNSSISTTEEYWRRFVSFIREANSDFETSYLLDTTQSQEILELSLDREFADIITIFEKAVEKDCLVLQLPIEDVV